MLSFKLKQTMENEENEVLDDMQAALSRLDAMSGDIKNTLTAQNRSVASPSHTHPQFAVIRE